MKRLLKEPVLSPGLLAALLLLTACSQATDDRNFRLSRTHFQMGADFLHKKRPLDAKSELTKAIQLDPDNRDAIHLLGILLFIEAMHQLNLVDRNQCLHGTEAEEQREVANKEFRRAEQYLTKSVNLAKLENKIESEGLLYLANIAIHFKRYPEAVSLSKRALENELFRGRHLLQAALGWAYFQSGDLSSAGRELRQAIYAKTDFCLAIYRLAKVYYAQKQYDRTQLELKKVGEYETCPIQEIPYLLGLAHMQKRSMQEAHRLFSLCAEKAPGSCLAEECLRLAKNASPVGATAPVASPPPAVEQGGVEMEAGSGVSEHQADQAPLQN